VERWAAEALHRALDKVAAQRNLSGYPHIVDHGQWVLTPDGAWTGGFWIGLLWALYEEGGDATVREQAERLLQGFLKRAGERTNHDLGFMFCPSAVAGWQITGEERYRTAALEAAASLAAQFHPRGRFIPGWGFFGGQEWQGRVLIDTLMNLPLLLWAAAQTGEQRYREVALAHADTTVRYHLRPDGSTYHVYRFEPESGAPIGGDTYQGRAPESCWSRGQAWALTGLTLLAEATGEDRYRAAAHRAAGYYQAHLPADHVPPWDFDVPLAASPRDSSAAAIAAFGLLRLAALSADPVYAQTARETLRALGFRMAYMTAPAEPAILTHATADLPHGLGVDASTIYGDYFFVRALQTLRGTPVRTGGCL
jgi:unsaturated chondroitin disaccharide hydrolase